MIYSINGSFHVWSSEEKDNHRYFDITSKYEAKLNLTFNREKDNPNELLIKLMELARVWRHIDAWESCPDLFSNLNIDKTRVSVTYTLLTKEFKEKTATADFNITKAYELRALYVFCILAAHLPLPESQIESLLKGNIQESRPGSLATTVAASTKTLLSKPVSVMGSIDLSGTCKEASCSEIFRIAIVARVQPDLISEDFELELEILRYALNVALAFTGDFKLNQDGLTTTLSFAPGGRMNMLLVNGKYQPFFTDNLPGFVAFVHAYDRATRFLPRLPYEPEVEANVLTPLLGGLLDSKPATVHAFEAFQTKDVVIDHAQQPAEVEDQDNDCCAVVSQWLGLRG